MNIFEKHKELLKRKAASKREAKEIPDALFSYCKKCGQSVLTSSLKDNKYVCPNCGNHFTISANERIRQILDEGSFKELDGKITTFNVNHFEGYDEKLDKAKARTGLKEAVVTGTGRIEGMAVCIGVMDSRFMMASMGMAVGEKLCRLIKTAMKKKIPLIIFCASGGARMQEGILSLVQMARTNALIEEFSQNGGLYISVLTNPTTGGVSASFASAGDIVLAEPEALVGFAGKRVIEKTIKEKLPDDFQKAESLQEWGFADAIVERKNMKNTLSYLLRIHAGVKPWN